MSNELVPNISEVIILKSSISGTLGMSLPAATRANMIGPLLQSVLPWGTQIPLMLEGNGPSASANLLFAIRKELFIPPSFSASVLGIPLVELPAPFQEFVALIQKVQEAQKDNAPVKVHYFRCSHYFLFLIYFGEDSPPRTNRQIQGLC